MPFLTASRLISGHDVTELRIGLCRLDTQQQYLVRLQSNVPYGRAQRSSEHGFILHVMVRRQQHDVRTWIALCNMQEGQQDTVRRATVLRLHDQVGCRQALPPSVMLRGDYCADLLIRRD